MRKLLLAIALVAAPLSSAPAQVLASAQGWTTSFAYGGPNGDVPMCIMGTRNDGKSLYVKAQVNRDGRRHGFIQLYNQSWDIAVPNQMEVNFNGTWHTLDYIPVNGMRTGLEASYPGLWNNFLGFVVAFAESRRMLVRFPNDDLSDWAVDLTGTMRVSRAFLECIAARL